MSTSVQNPETIPQAATNLLEVCARAILEGDLDKPIDEWLKAQNNLSPSARRQVASILLFLNLLGDSRRLIPEARAWRSDYESLSEALAVRVRHAYSSAGCDTSQAELIGNPLLTKEALGRVLQDEPPFQRLENPDTRRNAIRFACHVHEAIVKGKLIPRQDAEKDDASRNQRSREGAHAESRTPRTDASPTFNDQGTIVNPKRYRIARVQDDLWVYGTVTFESPKGAADFAWLSTLDADQQARWLEQLAAALLHDADSLKQALRCKSTAC